jgi:hypothetical protein
METVVPIALIVGGRGRRQAKDTSFGQRGGTSRNAGRKAVTYEALLPDGQMVRKTSFTVDQPVAVLGVYRHPDYTDREVWCWSGIAPEPQDWWSGQTFVEARRVS